jgi:general secretion pathway protein I
LLAQAKIAELTQRPPGSLTDGEGDFGDDFPGYSWRIRSAEAELPAAVDLPGRLLRVDLAVGLEADNRVYHLRSYTFVGP